MTEARRPKHSGSVALDGVGGPAQLRRVARLCRRASRQSRHLPVRARHARLLLAGRTRALLMRSAGHRAVRPRLEPARPALSGRRSATGPRAAAFMPECAWQPLSSGGGRIGDHRREVRLGGELAVDASRGRRTCRRCARFWTNSTSSLSSTPGSTGCAELRAVDRHEIDELARAGEAERSRPRARRRPGPAPRRSARRA